MASRAMDRWGNLETLQLISIMRELHIVTILDGNRRQANVFRRVGDELRERGYDRSIEQIRNRWKNLKSIYGDARRKLNTSACGVKKPKFYDELDELLGDRPIYNVDSEGVESQPKIVDEIEVAQAIAEALSAGGSVDDLSEVDDSVRVQSPENQEDSTGANEPHHKVRKRSGGQLSYENVLKRHADDQKSFIKGLMTEMNKQSSEIMMEHIQCQQMFEKEIFASLQASTHNSMMAAVQAANSQFQPPNAMQTLDDIDFTFSHNKAVPQHNTAADSACIFNKYGVHVGSMPELTHIWEPLAVFGSCLEDALINLKSTMRTTPSLIRDDSETKRCQFTFPILVSAVLNANIGIRNSDESATTVGYAAIDENADEVQGPLYLQYSTWFGKCHPDCSVITEPDGFVLCVIEIKHADIFSGINQNIIQLNLAHMKNVNLLRSSGSALATNMLIGYVSNGLSSAITLHNGKKYFKYFLKGFNTADGKIQLDKAVLSNTVTTLSAILKRLHEVKGNSSATLKLWKDITDTEFNQ